MGSILYFPYYCYLFKDFSVFGFKELLRTSSSLYLHIQVVVNNDWQTPAHQIGAVAGEATIFVLVNLLLLLKSFSSQGPLYGLYS